MPDKDIDKDFMEALMKKAAESGTTINIVQSHRQLLDLHKSMIDEFEKSMGEDCISLIRERVPKAFENIMVFMGIPSHDDLTRNEVDFVTGFMFNFVINYFTLLVEKIADRYVLETDES